MNEFTHQDALDGLCSFDQIGQQRPPAPEPRPHPLTAGLDLDHPDTDRAILRRLYHQDPQAFLNAYGTAGINKLMDLASKETAAPPFPDVTDAAAWQKLLNDVVKDASRQSIPDLASPVIVLVLLHHSAEGTGSVDLKALGRTIAGFTGVA